MQKIQIKDTIDILDIEIEDIQRLYRWALSMVTIHDMRRKHVVERFSDMDVEIKSDEAVDAMADIVSDYYPVCCKIVELFQDDPCIL